MLELIALPFEIALAVFFAFKSMRAYDRGNTVRIFVYGLISVCMSFSYVYDAAWGDRLDLIMGIAMSAFMFMVAYSITQFGNIFSTFSEDKRDADTKKQRREKLDEPLPKAAPLPYRVLRGIVQYFPYRIGLVAFGVYVYFWHMDAMSVTSTLIFLGYWALALVNGIYPFMTRPLRYRLISAVDRLFERIYMRQKKKKARTFEVVRTMEDTTDE